jgi:hypothetical protein
MPVTLSKNVALLCILNPCYSLPHCCLCLVHAATVDITDENDASQAVFSAILIALSVIMMVAALVQIGLVTKPAWQRLQHYVQYIIQRVFTRSGTSSGSAVTDVELTETVRGFDAAAVGSTVTAAQQHHSDIDRNRRTSIEGLLSEDLERDSSDSGNHAGIVSPVAALSTVSTAADRNAYAF